MTPRKSSAALDGSIKCPSSPYKIELPPTPEATPCRSLKRPSSDSLNVEEPAKVTLKRIDFGVRRSPHSVFDSRKVPEFSILSKRRPSAPCKLSAIELKRVAESILRQVNWVDVAADAASNRGAVAYRKAVKQIMQEQVEQLLRMEADDEVPLEST
ncbi:MAG: hypothetical protein M1830_010845 [Pleopsidium flavum]|nr:MAG: hypothetical protein M1830_010845 [Pleopsidium flavum]